MTTWSAEPIQASAFRDMLDAMNYGGKIDLLGTLPGETAIDWTKVIFKGLFLKGIYGQEMFETWYKMSTMLQSNLDISSIITHRFKVDDFHEAIDGMGWDCRAWSPRLELKGL